MSGRDVNQHIKVFVADKLPGSVFESSTGNAREQCRLGSVWCKEAVHVRKQCLLTCNNLPVIYYLIGYEGISSAM